MYGWFNFFKIKRCYLKVYSNLKWEKSQPKPKPKLLIKNQEEEESKPSLSTSTRSLNKCTLTLESRKRLWTSWTLSFMILLTELPLKDQNSLDLTREELFHPEKFNQLSNLSYQENLLDMLSLREPRLLLNTSSNDRAIAFVYYFIFHLVIAQISINFFFSK